jgi:pantothenate kinase type III
VFRTVCWVAVAVSAVWIEVWTLATCDGEAPENFATAFAALATCATEATMAETFIWLASVPAPLMSPKMEASAVGAIGRIGADRC